MKAPALKRVYDPPGENDGTRVLVDRLWPRGLSKERARIDLWLKDLAPSDALRRMAHADRSHWEAFVAAYARELEAPAARAALETLKRLIDEGPVTLLYAARDETENNAVALVRLLAREG